MKPFFKRDIYGFFQQNRRLCSERERDIDSMEIEL